MDSNRKPYRNRVSEFIARAGHKQNNVLWPDTLANARDVDELLWHGSVTATKVQKAGAVVFGVAFAGAGVGFLYISSQAHSWFLACFAIFWLLIGIRVCKKAFNPTARRN